eukprot:CAMPEP_0180502426 /NCGR_PEP_ID=MMETSP1036_2-20121128/45418_1 /TAXON_ID=632150 /ORGANISM="Azadinium spinosum, Strain 3D9" /LENGTH=502 /DNA_ID=CAMNT_0022511237 /DNA_START=21 /DNA_END=1530 /DNA_ORIENTATION=+
MPKPESKLSVHHYGDGCETNAIAFEQELKNHLLLLGLKLDGLATKVGTCVEGICELQQRADNTSRHENLNLGRSLHSRPSRPSSTLSFREKMEPAQGKQDQDNERLRYEESGLDPVGRKNSGVSYSSSVSSVVSGMERMTNRMSTLSQVQRARSNRAVQLWQLLENSESSVWAWFYAQIMPVLIVTSVIVTLLQTVDERDQLLGKVLAAVIETTFDSLFAIEFLLRFIVCPNRLGFVCNVYNILDAVAVVPLVLRIHVGFVLPNADEASAVESILLTIVPAIRLVKVLRFFPNFQLLYDAFKMAIETLPALLFTLALITLTFAALVYWIEDRDNIPTLPVALWLCIVTMTTVGYGDTVPKSGFGSVVVAGLVISSVMYWQFQSAYFTEVWADRHRILLVKRVRASLGKSGYDAHTIRQFFRAFDADQSGEIDHDEFRNMIRHMHLELSDALINKLFQSFDSNNSGSITETEFMETLFPGSTSRFPEGFSSEDARESEGDRHI